MSDTLPRTCISQLINRPISPENANSSDTIGSRSDHVVFPVTDHNDVIGIETVSPQNMGDETGFVAASSVQFTAIDHGEMFFQLEMLDDPPGKDGWLRRGNTQTMAFEG